MTGIIAQNVGRTSGLIKAASGGTSTGAWTLIKTLTASADSTLDFIDGTDDVVLDSTYPIYRFSFINMHAGTDNANLTFNMSIDSGSNYNVAKTTTFFNTYHDEADSSTLLGYQTPADLAQGTGFQMLLYGGLGNGNDESGSGEMWLFNPSSTTFVKHFMSTVHFYYFHDYAMTSRAAGYGNTTSAVDAIQFKMDSGNIDAGKIKLYGLGDS